MEKLNLFLDSVKEIITTKDYDWIHIVVGPEGIGKSSLAWSLCKHIDPDFNISKIVFSYKELADAISKSRPGNAILIDEGALVFYSRDSMVNVNKKAIKFMTAIRSYNQFIVICVPNFWLLDKYLRDHRIKTVSRVVKRGWVFEYSPRTVRIFKQNDKKKMQMDWPPPDGKDSFPDASKLWPKEWEEYKKKKESLAIHVENVAKESTNRKCQHCGYEWLYRGKLQHPTCPDCRNKL